MELTYVSTSGPAHSGEKLLTLHTAVEQPASPKATCTGAGRTLTHGARPLKFWPLRLLGDTVSHCEFFFFLLSSPIGCIPSVRKCVTALQKQHLFLRSLLITPLLSICVHFRSHLENMFTPLKSEEHNGFLEPRKARDHLPSGYILEGQRGLLTFDP